MARWVKVPHKYEAVFQLEKREGVRKISFRYRFRKDGFDIEGTLNPYKDDGSLRQVKDLSEEAERLISKERNREKALPASLVRSETLCDQVVEFKKKADQKDTATYDQAETIARLHIKPFLRKECAYEKDDGFACKHFDYINNGSAIYASELNATTWLSYKTHLRQHRPEQRLFNHWKIWVQICNLAHSKGYIKEKIKLDFNEKKEDPRERGQRIPEEHFKGFLRCANQTWHDRALLQKMTLQRPGVIRKLRKEQFNSRTRKLIVKRLDSKNRTIDYGFMLPQAAIDILTRRLETVPGPYFFPSRGDENKHMDTSLKGWHSAWKKTGVAEEYTPHDIRHTELTRRFKKAINPALLCYQADLSLEEAMETYIHFEAEDTMPIAEESQTMIADFLGLRSPLYQPQEIKILPAEVRARLQELYEKSGLGMVEFCNRVGIRRQTFRRYLTKGDLQLNQAAAANLILLNKFFTSADNANPLGLPEWMSVLASHGGALDDDKDESQDGTSDDSQDAQTHGVGGIDDQENGDFKD